MGGNPIEVPYAPQKAAQILAAAKAQLPDEEYREVAALLSRLQYGRLTADLNARLGTLMSRIEWELEVSESPEWAEALIECDRAFLGTELKLMCDDMGIETGGHKKILCRRLYNAGHPGVVAAMAPFLKNKEQR